MAFTLLDCSNGVSSLEFAESDIDRLKSFLETEYGRPRIKRRIVHDELTFSNEQFTFYNEWGDPCLISSTAQGRAILQKIAEKLNASA